MMIENCEEIIEDLMQHDRIVRFQSATGGDTVLVKMATTENASQIKPLENLEMIVK